METKEETKRLALDRLIRSVKDAVMAYDASGDHVHMNAHTGDCIRCAVVAAIGGAK